MIMTKNELEGYANELRAIHEEESTEKKGEKLTNLGKRVGASQSTETYQRFEAEMFHNINDALRTHAMILQTDTMIDICKTAGKSYIIAIIAAIAAWAAVLVSVFVIG